MFANFVSSFLIVASVALNFSVVKSLNSPYIASRLFTLALAAFKFLILAYLISAVSVVSIFALTFSISAELAVNFPSTSIFFALRSSISAALAVSFSLIVTLSAVRSLILAISASSSFVFTLSAITISNSEILLPISLTSLSLADGEEIFPVTKAV